jgi:multisubunit Na+/H+ antiporter MnhG subunit
LSAGSFDLWLLDLFYTRTIAQSRHASGGAPITVRAIRFYLRALGLIAMLAGWLVIRFGDPPSSPRSASASLPCSYPSNRCRRTTDPVAPDPVAPVPLDSEVDCDG